MPYEMEMVIESCVAGDIFYQFSKVMATRPIFYRGTVSLVSVAILSTTATGCSAATESYH